MTLFDSEPALSKEEIVEVTQYAGKRIALWRKRSIYSTVALLLSCALVYPFLEGHTLHSYWESFGKYLIFISMALLVVWVNCAGLWWSAWQALRDAEKGRA